MSRRLVPFVVGGVLALAALVLVSLFLADRFLGDEETGLDENSTAAEAGLCLGIEDPGMTYVVGYRVADGQLGDVCFGDANAELESAWGILSTIVPADQLRDLSSFNGYRLQRGDTLAFVVPIDDTGSTFEMAVNVDETEDQWELNLTMLHEFSHVFTATPNELDLTLDEDECETYWNGEGCYLSTSIMAEWVERFWQNEISIFDPTAPGDNNGGDARCQLNPGYFGAYAATSPEEDFAEAFSAFVFRLPPDTDGQQERLDWIGAQPGLVEFRDRAAANGFENQLNYFDVCG